MSTFDIINLSERPEVFPTVAGWHWDEWGHTDPAGSLESWTAGLARRNSKDGIPATYAAFTKDNEPIGSVVLVENDMASHAELMPWMAGLFVLPRYRNRGVGAGLARHAMGEAWRFGFSKLHLHTSTAVQLYEDLGWTTLFREFYEGAEVDVMACVRT